jgi:hypothetical protein
MPGTDIFSAKRSMRFANGRPFPVVNEERKIHNKALKAAIFAETELFIERVLALKAELHNG